MSFISGWHLLSADAINDRGNILAHGRHEGQKRACLLIPDKLRKPPYPVTSETPPPVATHTPVNLESLTRLPDGTILLRIQATVDGNYVVEASTDLVAWTPLGSMISMAGRWEYVDKKAADFRLRFYRVKRVP